VSHKVVNSVLHLVRRHGRNIALNEGADATPHDAARDTRNTGYVLSVAEDLGIRDIPNEGGKLLANLADEAWVCVKNPRALGASVAVDAFTRDGAGAEREHSSYNKEMETGLHADEERGSEVYGF
jgi:hypothetical protein